MSSLVSISFASDTVSSQETGISAHTSQCLSTHNPFGLTTKSPASKWVHHFEPSKHEVLIQEITTPLKEEKKYNAWSSLWISWLKALEAEFEPRIRVPQCPRALLCPADSRACQWWKPWTWRYHNVSPGLNRSKCQQLLWMRTHKSWVGWKPVLDNSSGLIHKECWRGGGEAAEDRQLFKPAAKPLQPLTRTQSPACVLPNSKLPGIQKLRVQKEIYTNFCQEISFSKCKLVIPRMAEGDFSLLLQDSLCLYASKFPN